MLSPAILHTFHTLTQTHTYTYHDCASKHRTALAAATEMTQCKMMCSIQNAKETGLQAIMQMNASVIIMNMFFCSSWLMAKIGPSCYFGFFTPNFSAIFFFLLFSVQHIIFFVMQIRRMIRGREASNYRRAYNESISIWYARMDSRAPHQWIRLL